MAQGFFEVEGFLVHAALLIVLAKDLYRFIKNS
jgi:hypothetical protein